MEGIKEISFNFKLIVSTIFVFLMQTILVDTFKLSFEYSILSALTLSIYVFIGLSLESNNRNIINKFIEQNKYNNFRKNTIFDPLAINKSNNIRFLRVWYFISVWPYFMTALMKTTKSPK